jgi:hypothetical protein
MSEQGKAGEIAKALGQWSKENHMPLVESKAVPGGAVQITWRSQKPDGRSAEIKALVLDNGNVEYALQGVGRDAEKAMKELVRTVFRPESSM